MPARRRVRGAGPQGCPLRGTFRSGFPAFGWQGRTGPCCGRRRPPTLTGRRHAARLRSEPYPPCSGQLQGCGNSSLSEGTVTVYSGSITSPRAWASASLSPAITRRPSALVGRFECRCELADFLFLGIGQILFGALGIDVDQVEHARALRQPARRPSAACAPAARSPRWLPPAWRHHTALSYKR